MSESTILIVEDDTAMGRLLSSHLKARGYEAILVTNGNDALSVVREKRVDLVLLDISLPGGLDGFEVCARLRAISTTPIIMVTAAQRPETKVRALDLGGDDYLTKPFDADELLARIRAVLRRTGQPESQPMVIQAGEITVDLVRREVTRGSDSIHLTKTEFDLLALLLRNPERTLTYKQILEAVWGPRYDDIRPLHVHVSHLRRKLGERTDSGYQLLAVPGVGYRLRLLN